MIQKHVHGDSRLAARGYAWHAKAKRCAGDCGKTFHLLHWSGRCMICMRPRQGPSLPPGDTLAGDGIGELEADGLSPKVISLLSQAGYMLADQVCNLTASQIMGISNLGKRAVQEIQSAVERYRERRNVQPTVPKLGRLEEWCRHCARVTVLEIDQKPTCTIYSCNQCGGTIDMEFEKSEARTGCNRRASGQSHTIGG